MDYIKEPEKLLPVRYEADVFVAGGSCTGLFAAVRAARLGARVVLVERRCSWCADTELRADFHIFGKQGEAAGTAAYLCLAGNKALSALDGKRVRECLKQGGSAL